MKIYLSADIHHMSLQTGNQKHCDITELQTAKIFIDMLEKAQVKSTCFMTGKCFQEEWQDTQVICNSPFVDIGGHTWNGFTPEILHRIFKKVLGSYNGPYWYQHADIARTVNIIKAKTGKSIKVWRNHMYMHGPHTENALVANGIQLCSDGVKKHCRGPIKHESGLLNFPLNIMPDHEHIYHAERTPEWVDKWLERYKWSDDFGSQSYAIEEWADIVIMQINECVRLNRDVNMLIHPITMYLADGFKSFNRILDVIKQNETVWLGECVTENSAHEIDDLQGVFYV